MEKDLRNKQNADPKPIEKDELKEDPSKKLKI